MNYDHEEHTLSYTQSKKSISIIGLDSFYLRQLLKEGIIENTNIKINDKCEIVLEFKKDKTDVYISIQNDEINTFIFNFNFSFSGTKFQKDILRVIDLYEKQFEIEKKDEQINVLCYDDIIRKFKISNKQLSKIMDKGCTSTLNIKGTINNEYHKVKLKLTNESVEVLGNDEIKYIFNRKTFISKLNFI